MRIRIDSDNAKKVNAARKKNGAEGKPLSAHQEVNKALAIHYASARSPQITEAMIQKAHELYAEERSPERWDGPPWGEAGRANHRRAIVAVLRLALAP